MRSHLLAFLAVTTASLLACGGSQPPAAPPSTPTETAEPGAADAGTGTGGETTDAESTSHAAQEGPSFDDLPMEEKVEVMSSKVVPNVGKLFKEHDGKKFAKFGCTNCHGPQKKDDPRKVLPKLTLSNGGFEKLSKAKPEMMQFMSEKVVPAMAEALNEKPYDPVTHKGFGCAGCHSVD